MFVKKKQVQKSVWLSLIVLTVIFGNSCKSFSFWFAWADTYLSWQIDKYFDVTNEQEAFIDQRLDQLLLNFKFEEIPKYIGFLEEIKARTSRPLTPEDMNWFRDELNQFNSNLAYLLADDATQFLSGISERQIAYLERALEDNNQSWLEEHKARNEASRDEKLARVYERTENWIGDLTDQQKKEISALYQDEDFSYTDWYNRRKASQQQFLEIVKQDFTQAELRNQLLDWYLNREKTYSEEYKEHQRQRNLRTTKMVLLLDQTATEEQRQFFEEKVDYYIDQLNQILID